MKTQKRREESKAGIIDRLYDTPRVEFVGGYELLPDGGTPTYSPPTSFVIGSAYIHNTAKMLEKAACRLSKTWEADDLPEVHKLLKDLKDTISRFEEALLKDEASFVRQETPELVADGGELRDLNVGDKITIFKDPLTRLKPEGEATLVKKITRIDETLIDYLERWTVRFDDYGTVDRNIYIGGRDAQLTRVRKEKPELIPDGGTHKRLFNAYKYLDLPAPKECRPGLRFREFGGLWQITHVSPDLGESPHKYLIQARFVKKDGTLGKRTLSYWTDKPIESVEIRRK